MLIEEKIIGRETTVGILDDQPLPIVEVRPKSGVYDYRTKYSVGATGIFAQHRSMKRRPNACRRRAWRRLKAIGGRDYSRVDVMVRANGDPVVLEVKRCPA